MIIFLLTAALTLALGLLIWMPSTYVVGALATVFAVLIVCVAMCLLTNGDDPTYYTGGKADPAQESRHARK